MLVVLSSLLILSSCTIEKRKHLAGYHIDFVKSKRKITAENTIEPDVKSIDFERKPETIHGSNPLKNPLATIEGQRVKRKEVKEKEAVVTCDRLTLKNGDELAVKVLEITETEVKYKKCDFPDGPTISISKSRVFMIVYSNGSKEVFNSTDERFETTDPNPVPSDTKLNTLSVVGLVFSILAILTSVVPILGWLFGILGIIMGSAALGQIAREPNKFHGKGFAVAAIILGIVGFLLGIAWFIVNLIYLGLI